MTFHEWMQQAEENFGPEAMRVFDKCALGEITVDVCIEQMINAIINYKEPTHD